MANTYEAHQQYKHGERLPSSQEQQMLRATMPGLANARMGDIVTLHPLRFDRLIAGGACLSYRNKHDELCLLNVSEEQIETVKPGPPQCGERVTFGDGIVFYTLHAIHDGTAMLVDGKGGESGAAYGPCLRPVDLLRRA